MLVGLLLVGFLLVGCATRIPVASAAGQSAERLELDAEACRATAQGAARGRVGYWMACKVSLDYRTYVAIAAPAELGRGAPIPSPDT